MTKAIIDGKTYNTDTADHLGRIGGGSQYVNDFSHWRAELYRTKKGAFFMDGHGGPSSPFAMPYERNGSIGGDGIRVLDAETALRYAERDFDAETVEKYFGDMITEA